jgi:hypothetical protein
MQVESSLSAELTRAARFSSALDTAVAWVAENLDQFDPFYAGRDYDVEHGQRVTELATMIHAYSQLRDDRDSRPVIRVLDFLQTMSGRREWRDRLLRTPAEFVLFADVCVVLDRLGIPDRGLEELVQRVIDAGYLDAVERLPHRLMDVRMTLELGNWHHSWRSQAELFPTTVLGKEQSALLLDEGSTYALTHVLLFWFGFGLHRRELPSQSLQPLLAQLVVSACQERHWDLLTELLLCWDCADLPATVVSELAWDALLGVQNEDGSFPGPDRALIWNDPRDPRLTEDAKRRSYFAHHYHTTCVAAIALARHQTDGSLPQQIATPRRDRSRHHALDETPFERGWAWLDNLVSQATDDPQATRRHFNQALIGCWACANALTNTDRFHTSAAAVHRALSKRAAGDTDTPLLPLDLLTAVLLEREGLSSGSLISQDIPTRIPGAVPAGARLSECLKSLELPLGHAETQHLLHIVDTFTRHGTHPIALPGDCVWLSDLLTGLSAHLLRQYELETAAATVRALIHLGLAADEIEEACHFAALHQRSTGAFGFFGPEEPALRKSLGEHVNLDLELHLPTTVAWLWTLAEASSPWRLFASRPPEKASEPSPAPACGNAP